MGLFEECHGCTDRVVGCHSKCKRYKIASEKNEKIKTVKNADIDARAYTYNVKCDHMAKQAMKRKRHVDYRRNYK